MKRIALAAALTAFAAGAAFAQEAPYTVREGQVKYPGQMQWNAPVDGYASPYYGDPYYGGASMTAPGPGVYVGPADTYYDGPGYDRGLQEYDGGDRYNQHGPGAYIFDGEVVNSDQNYSGR